MITAVALLSLVGAQAPANSEIREKPNVYLGSDGPPDTDLVYQMIVLSGSKICDKRKRLKRLKRFHAQFDDRMMALNRKIDLKYGVGAANRGVIFTTECQNFPEDVYDRLSIEFDQNLSRWEHFLDEKDN